MKVFRSLLGSFVALALVLTSVQTAVARGQPAPKGMMVICAGATVVTVFVDADGQPVERRHLCPEGAFALFMFDPGSAVFQPPQVAWSAVVFSTRAAGKQGAVRLAAQARGPPVSV